MQTVEFPFSNYWWFYLSFLVFISILLYIDLHFSGKSFLFWKRAQKKGSEKKSRELPSDIQELDPQTKNSGIWCIFWVSLALIFNVFLYYFTKSHFLNSGTETLAAHSLAKKLSLEFLTGYLVELALSVDNLFVFIVIFNYFAIPKKYQRRVLYYGILGAVFFRTIFISLGSLVMYFHVTEIIFGAILIFTGLKTIFKSEKEIKPEKNPLLKILKKYLPVTNSIDSEHFFKRINRQLFATPLFVVLIFIEFTDIVFAVDSVPAIFSITKEPLIVYTSNLFAILGLRSFYFLLSGIMEKFYLLSYGLGAILIFIGAKMIYLEKAFPNIFGIETSLFFILACLTLTIVLSLMFPKKVTAKK